ncbi:MAG: TlpA family protein disulfide reductase [Chloroflexota bacterium]
MATGQRSNLAIGERMPDLTLPTLEGGDLRLRDLEGRRVLLFCWASW